MNKESSMYTENTPNSMGAESQIRWCYLRCKMCHSIFTVTVLKDDIPVATKCMCCDTLFIYHEKDLKEMKLI
jgi:hypothetical protein